MKKTSILLLMCLQISFLTGDLLFASVDIEDRAYKATITRDIWGVPHVFGKTDADAAFGMAFAHAQDDIKNLTDNIILYRAEMGLKQGFKGLVSDYLIKALEIREMVVADYDNKLSSQVREVIEGYVAGLNHWVDLHPNRDYQSLFPITKYDIVSGFVIQNLFFSGVVDAIEKIQSMDANASEITAMNQNPFIQSADLILGSNAFAVGPTKTDDGSTRLIINSHQPLEGSLAWYEAHITSEEGWNMMGGLFPGSPFVFVGFNDDLGWGFTVNKPDLTDIYTLEINPKNKNQYLMDGLWVDFEIRTLKLPTKLFGPFKWTIRRKAKYSKHGPVFETKSGVYAVRFAGMNDIAQVEQWYRMNKSKNMEEWLEAMRMRSIVSFNAVYADKKKNILFLHNAASPVREESIDWKQSVDGTKSALIWNELVPLEQLPLIINPASGWLTSNNQDPFKVTSKESNLNPENYSKTLGLQTRMTNRAFRALELFNAYDVISEEALMDIKFDNQYSKDSRSYKYIETIFNETFTDPDFKEAQAVLKRWNLNTNFDNRSATLGVCVLGPEWLAEQNDQDPPKPLNVFKKCVKDIKKSFKRIDPLWSERNLLFRGNKRVPVQGGPDTLRAIYGRVQENGQLRAVAGDGLVVLVEWDRNGVLKSKSIHQYGSATQDENSVHFDDQMMLYANEQLKDTFFNTVELEKHSETKITIP
jgi:penicillin amidase/acyl-homoserine-lactone acylase